MEKMGLTPVLDELERVFAVSEKKHGKGKTALDWSFTCNMQKHERHMQRATRKDDETGAYHIVHAASRLLMAARLVMTGNHERSRLLASVVRRGVDREVIASMCVADGGFRITYLRSERPFERFHDAMFELERIARVFDGEITAEREVSGLDRVVVQRVDAELFALIWNGRVSSLAAERDCEVGDTLVLWECDGKERTGRVLMTEVTATSDSQVAKKDVSFWVFSRRTHKGEV